MTNILLEGGLTLGYSLSPDP